MNNRATNRCIMCGELAELYHGHVIARERMALGNLIEVKILAGFCKDCDGKIQSDETGCYGRYNQDLGIRYLKFTEEDIRE